MAINADLKWAVIEFIAPYKNGCFSHTTDTKWDCSNAAVMLGQQQSTGKSTVWRDLFNNWDEKPSFRLRNIVSSDLIWSRSLKYRVLKYREICGGWWNMTIIIA